MGERVLSSSVNSAIPCCGKSFCVTFISSSSFKTPEVKKYTFPRNCPRKQTTFSVEPAFCFTLKTRKLLSRSARCSVIPDSSISGNCHKLSDFGLVSLMWYCLFLSGVNSKLPIPAWTLLNCNNELPFSNSIPSISTGSPLIFTALKASLFFNPETW
jgi:hypothetical protein